MARGAAPPEAVGLGHALEAEGADEEFTASDSAAKHMAKPVPTGPTSEAEGEDGEGDNKPEPEPEPKPGPEPGP